METFDHAGYEFGPYRLLIKERLLLRDRKPIPLAPKVFDTLLVLVSHHERLVTKEELMQLIWGKTIVEEANLTQNIFLLRKILGEARADHRYIVTVPLRGYRFVAAVRQLAREEVAGRDIPTRETPAKRSIAVLPFTFLNAPPDRQFEALGLADTLITKLNVLKNLIIRPTSAVMRYIGFKDDLITIGSDLRVNSILDGTMQLQNNQLRVNVQLIDIDSGNTLWAEQYNEDYSHLFAVQDAIAEKIVTSLKLELTGEERNRLAKRHSRNADAYQLYVKARYFSETRSEAGLKKAIDYAQQAIAIDPIDARAYVSIADSYAFLAEYLFLPPQLAFPKAKKAAQRALEVDPQNAEAYASLAEVNFFYDWQWSTAERNYQRALELNPNYASAHHLYSWFLMTMGRHDEALDHIRDAQTIDPRSLILNTVLGLPFYYQGLYKQAIAQFRSTLELDPDFAQARYYLGSALTHAGAFEEAAREFEQVLQVEYYQQTLTLLAYACAGSGKLDRARDALEELQRLSRTNYVSPYLLAIVMTGLGDFDAALKELERGFAERAAWMVFLGIDPFLNKLRHLPQFDAVSKMMALAPDRDR